MVVLGALTPILAGFWLVHVANERYDGPVWHALLDSKYNLHQIQLALERYAVDHSNLYPLTVGSDFMVQWPRNPYDAGPEDQPAPEFMQPVVPAGHQPGCFSYFPLLATPDAPGATGYVLLLYCNDATAGRLGRQNAERRRKLPGGAEEQVSWRHVLLVLTNDRSARY